MTGSAPAAWLVRAGRGGEREDAALSEGLVIIGWEELGDLSDCRSKEELRERVRRTYPDDGKARIANWTGQLWRFFDTIQIGDHVVLPLKTVYSCVAVGRVTGPYEYRDDSPEGFRHVRQVKWLRTDISRDEIKQDLRDSMGSLLTVCGLTRFDAARRISYLAEHGVDPGADTPQGDVYEAASSSELLTDAAGRDPDNPVRLTIRAFLEHWGAARRIQTVVARIEEDLAERGLTTRPPFTEGWINNTIELVPLGEEPAAERPSVASQIAEDTEDISEIPPVTLRVGDLEAANRDVAAVAPGTPLHTATTMMLLKGYSQLAVISGEGTYHGAVSWESIGRAHIADPEATLEDATVAAPLVEYDELLLDQIDQIYGKGFVFVRSADKTCVSGIVTAADLTRQFGDLARPFVLIEEAERRLRHRVDSVFTLEEIRAAAMKKPASVQSAADLTLGNYWHLLNAKDPWNKLGWNLDHRLFLALLKAVNEIRNETMHFSPDPLTQDQLDQLNGFVGLLRTVDPKF